MPRGVNLLDEARIQGRLWKPRGLTNLLAQSENLATSPWSPFFNNSGSATYAANSAASPGGRVTATLVTLNRTSASDWAQESQTLTTSAATHTFVLWLKAFSATDAGKLVTMGMYSGSPFDMRGTTNVALTEDWARFAITGVMPASSGAQGVFGYFDVSGYPAATTQTGQVKFYVAKAQMFVGSTVIPYLETGATAVTTPTAGAMENSDKGEAYDLWKYGYQDQLGAGHLYRNRPPMIGY